jgi:hypothetical protein
MILAGPHDRLPGWPAAARAQPAGFPRSSTSGPAPAAYWPPIVTQRTHHAGEAGDRRPRLPTAETGVFSRGCPKLTPGRTLIAGSGTGSVGQANA